MPTKDFTRKTATAVGFGENVAVLGQAFGDPQFGKGLSNSPSTDASVQPAGLFSTAPYLKVRPGASVSLVKIEAIREDVDRDERYGKCYGANDTCAAWATKKYDGLCNAHGRMAMGLSAYSPKGGDDGRSGVA
jgi:hypothetical protein